MREGPRPLDARAKVAARAVLATIRFENGSVEAAIDQEVLKSPLVLKIVFLVPALHLI